MPPTISQDTSAGAQAQPGHVPGSQLSALVQLLDTVDAGDAEVFRDTFLRGLPEHQVCQKRQISPTEYGDRIKRVVRLIKRGPARSAGMQPSFAGA